MKLQLALALLLFAGCASNKPTAVVVLPSSTPAATPTTKPTPRSKPKATPVPVPRTIGEVRAVEFSPDKRYLAVGTRREGPAIDGVITVRDCATNHIVKTWTLSGGAKFLAFSPDGKWLASTGAYADLRVWDWRSARIVRQQKLNTGLGSSDWQALAFSPSGRFLAVGVDGVRLLNTKSWKSRHLLRVSVPYGMVGFVRFSPDGRFLLTSDGFEGYDGYNLIPLTGGRTRTTPEELGLSIPVFSRNGRWVAGSSSGLNGAREAFVRNGRTLRLKQTFKSEPFQPQDFSPDNRFVVGLHIEYNRTIVEEGPIEIWSVATGKRVRRFKQRARRVVWLKPKTLLTGDEKGVQRLSFKL